MGYKAISHHGLPELLAMLNTLGVAKEDIVALDHDATSGTYFCVYVALLP